MADDENEGQHEAQVDLTKKYTVKVVESHMTTEHEQDAIQFSLEAFHTYRHLKDQAQHIKQVSGTNKAKTIRGLWRLAFA